MFFPSPNPESLAPAYPPCPREQGQPEKEGDGGNQCTQEWAVALSKSPEEGVAASCGRAGGYNVIFQERLFVPMTFLLLKRSHAWH